MITRREMTLGGLAGGGLAGSGLETGLWPRAAAAQTASPVARTTHGPVIGARDGGTLWFKGVRYGADTGPRRFQPPVAPTPWTEPVECLTYGAASPQRSDEANPSEDCLFLNVWTPGLDRERRPVMVYIHGGAYSNGSGSNPLYDGTRLSRRGDVVVVTLNHRLNLFGYAYLARLTGGLESSGNAGNLDLILALKWVRDNIAAFGGDPDRVMLFGQSGGGAKIATLMGMPAAKGLFHSAATMSGQQVTASGPINAHKRAQAVLAKLGVREDKLQPLLDMPIEKLLEGTSAVDPILGGGVYFGPVLDMKWLVRHPFWPDANPQSTAIPMILGNTRDETRAFIDSQSDKVKGLNWDNLADRIAPELRMDLLPEWVVGQYRGHFPADTPEQIFYRATTAGRSWPGQVIEADARAAAGAKATWVYQVDFQSPTQPERGAPHTMDIALAFGTLGAPGSYTGTGPDAQRLSRQVMAAFASLARTGKPGWAPYTLPGRATMVFDANSRVVNDPRKWERELFARVPYIQPGS